MVARGGEDPGLFVLGARTLGLAEAVEEALPAEGSVRRKAFRRLLRALDSPVLGLLLLGRARRFASFAHPDRERYLRTMATSPIPHLRTGFEALRRLGSFLFYADEDDAGCNPTWERIGYSPAPSPEVTPTSFPTPHIREGEVTCDACVIGSGAGGSVAAAELARAGRSVLVIEAGGTGGAPAYAQRERSATRDLYLDHGTASTPDLSVSILAGATLGGGTPVNWQTSFRTSDAVRAEWAEISGCGHFVNRSFDESLDRVTDRLRVSTEESDVNANNAVLRRGCERLGLRHSLIPRNAAGCESDECGYCIFGCRRGGKQSAAVTYLADAAATGNATVLTGCRAERVRIEAGRATGVDAVLGTGAEERPLRIRCDTVIVAAGAIHSPLLLMRSGVGGTALGRNLSLHPTAPVAGLYDQPVRTWEGPPQTIVCDELAEIDGSYGVRFESAPPHPGLLALCTPWTGARDHRRRMQDVSRYAATIALVRDRGRGRVRQGRDGRAVVEYRPGAPERALLRRGLAELVRIHLAAGAEEVFTLHADGRRLRGAASPKERERFLAALLRDPVDRNRSVLFSAHQMGSCRMGSSARTAVCGPDGGVFGARGLYVSDASAFPASSGVNPMISIMALADHTARGITGG